MKTNWKLTKENQSDVESSFTCSCLLYSDFHFKSQLTVSMIARRRSAIISTALSTRNITWLIKSWCYTLQNFLAYIATHQDRNSWLLHKYKHAAISFILAYKASRAVYRRGQRLFDFSNCLLDSRREHGSVLWSLVCYKEDITAKNRSLSQRSSNESVKRFGIEDTGCPLIIRIIMKCVHSRIHN